MSALPRMSRVAVPAVPSAPPSGSVSAVTPGFTRAGSIVCINQSHCSRGPTPARARSAASRLARAAGASMLASPPGASLRGVAGAAPDGDRRIAPEPGIAEGQPAQVELRPPVAPDHLDVLAGAAEPRGMPRLGGLAAGFGHLADSVYSGNMFTSEAVTQGLRIRVESEYSPERSNPCQQQWFFLYT